MKQLIRVGIIEDNETELEQFRQCINAGDQMTCDIAVSSAEKFFKHIQAFDQLDILLLDISCLEYLDYKLFPKSNLSCPI